VCQRIGKKTTKCTCNNAGAEENAQTPLQLKTFVPHTYQVNGSRNKAGFEYSKKKSHGHQTSKTADESLSDGTDAPEKHDSAEPCGRGDFLDDYVAGDFQKYVRDEKDE
jgi:hypothetical protein